MTKTSVKDFSLDQYSVVPSLRSRRKVPIILILVLIILDIQENVTLETDDVVETVRDKEGIDV